MPNLKPAMLTLDESEVKAAVADLVTKMGYSAGKVVLGHHADKPTGPETYSASVEIVPAAKPAAKPRVTRTPAERQKPAK